MKKYKSILKYILLTGSALIVLLPLLWTLYASLVMDDLDINTALKNLSKYSIDNFIYILTKGKILTWFRNSAIVVVVITFFNLLFNSMAGYGLARFDFKFKKVIFFYILGTMMIPMQVLTIPIFLVVNKLNLINTLTGIIVPFLVNAFGVFLMKQFFETFPKDIEEAARIDGLGEFGTFFRVVLPLAKNAIMTQAIFIFVWNWNNFMIPSVIVTDSNKFTLPLGMYQLTNTQYVTSITKSMAGVTLTLLPTIIFYLIFQKKLIENSVSSGIKG